MLVRFLWPSPRHRREWVVELHRSNDRAAVILQNERVVCWNSDCFVRVGSDCSCQTAGPFLTHIRWPTGTRSGTAIPSSLFRQHLGH